MTNRIGATYLQALQAIAKTRKTLFFNGSLCVVNFETLTILNVHTQDKIKLGTIRKLANALRRGEFPLLAERIREKYATID